MAPMWPWIIDVLALSIAITLALFIVMAVRRWIIGRKGTTIDLSVTRNTESDASGWIIGVGRYRGDELAFFRLFSLWPSPRYTFRRGTVEVVGRRGPSARESRRTHHSFVVAQVQAQNPVSQVALTPGALTALLAWLESSPPGHNVNNVV